MKHQMPASAISSPLASSMRLHIPTQSSHVLWNFKRVIPWRLFCVSVVDVHLAALFEGMLCHIQVLSDSDSDRAYCGSDSDREAETSFMEGSSSTPKSTELSSTDKSSEVKLGRLMPSQPSEVRNNLHQAIKVLFCWTKPMAA